MFQTVAAVISRLRGRETILITISQFKASYFGKCRCTLAVLRAFLPLQDQQYVCGAAAGRSVGGQGINY